MIRIVEAMRELYPCGGCGRHNRVEDTLCPFCGFRSEALPARRRSRAGAVIVATALGAVLAGCPKRGPEPMPAYGAPPPPPHDEVPAPTPTPAPDDTTPPPEPGPDPGTVRALYGAAPPPDEDRLPD